MSHPFPMRQMLHTSAKRYIWGAFAVSIASVFGLYAFYVGPRHAKYEEFFKNYNGFERMKEICAANKGYMHTCPHELAKLYEEKGKPVAQLQ